jgi:hypothetical protein
MYNKNVILTDLCHDTSFILFFVILVTLKYIKHLSLILLRNVNRSKIFSIVFSNYLILLSLSERNSVQKHVETY